MSAVLYLSISGIIYMAMVWFAAPRKVNIAQFFGGQSTSHIEPSFWLLTASAAISWIFAKSIVNSAALTHSFGLWGGFGYAVYYLSFVVVAITVYQLRVKGGYSSLPSFICQRYGGACMKLFLLAISIRLFNEVWSNTKVVGLFFGNEGSGGYWGAVLVFTLFTAFYTLRSGLRGSLLTDSLQMLLAAVLLAIILSSIFPAFSGGFPESTDAQITGGITFTLLALVQIASYGFHDPVLTDRAFITNPQKMLRAFITAGLIGGAFIMLFGFTGLYARTIGFEGGNIMSSIAGAVSLPLLVVFNVMMLTSAGSTMDSTFSSTAKMAAIDYSRQTAEPTTRHLKHGRIAIVVIALLGNLPLLTLYMGDQIGPAIIKATTISGTMIMGLAPVFLLCFVKQAGKTSFHLSFWTGLVLGIALATGSLPAWLAVGEGKYALSLGTNLYGLLLCCFLYVVGAFIAPAKR